jgi:hypothetical protein
MKQELHLNIAKIKIINLKKEKAKFLGINIKTLKPKTTKKTKNLQNTNNISKETPQTIFEIHNTRKRFPILKVDKDES